MDRCRCRWLAALVLLVLGVAGTAFSVWPLTDMALAQAAGQGKQGQDWPMFGGSPSRNMVNTVATHVPTQWQVEEKLENIKWVAKLGSRSYGGPVVAEGRVFIGTNNDVPRDPRIKGSKAVLMCFRVSDGQFLWQNAHDMPPAEIVREALRDGLCSTPAVAGDKVYYVTPASQVICAKTSTGEIVWRLDMMEKFKVYPNYVSNCSPLIVGDLVYIITGNGTNEEGKIISPTAPSFLALSKDTGAVKWKSALPGAQIIEGQWSNPAYAEIDGKGQVIFPGGDAYLYGLEPQTGELLWKFDCNPKKEAAAARKRGIPNYIVSTPVVYDKKVYVGVGLYPEHPVGNKVGHFWCLDLVKAVKLGAGNKNHDVSFQEDNFSASAPVNKNSALLWHYGGELEPRPKFGRSVHFGRTISTAAIHDNLVYIAEEYGYMHCLDAQTGKKYWEHDFKTGIWGSPLYVDGKIYIGNEDGDVIIFQAGKDKKELETIYMGEQVRSAPVVAEGTLFIMTGSKLFAIGKK